MRAQIEASGKVIARPVSPDGAPGEQLTEYQERIGTLIKLLLEDVPDEREQRTEEHQAKWLLANMLDWYRREEKATWWEFFRLRELRSEEMLEEKTGIGYLTFTGSTVPDKKSVIDEYNFPRQLCELKEGNKLWCSEYEKQLGTVFEIDDINYKIKIRKGPLAKDIHPHATFIHDNLPNDAKEGAIERLAKWVIANGINSNGEYRVGRDLLLNLSPRITGTLDSFADSIRTSINWLNLLDHGALPIQGPPGAGKSHTAAEMILGLLQSGKKVGITAVSHKVIINLMQKVIKGAQAKNIAVKCMRKVSSFSDNPDPLIIEEDDNKRIVAALKANEINLLGGTSWLWAREDMGNSIDVLFVDEAGQLSLIDTVAASQAATNLVLLGDPQQLKQPQQGSHPEGTEVSALEHILGTHKTIPADRGIFLDKTWRMHPNICSFISEVFYEGKLASMDDLANQVLVGCEEFDGAGLFFRPVSHEGNQGSSVEEVNYVKDLVAKLTNGNTFFIDCHNVKTVLTTADIKVITPYNAQVNLLLSMLPPGVQVGTVDKFQGQEAPVIIFSMATSSPADAPRGMDFLYSGNRFNVAVSRARAAFILVASPQLFEPDCKSVEQVRLANAFCRFLEIAR